MSKNKTTLAAEARAKAGKGAARAVRRTGCVPAVIYGDSKEPVLLSLTEKELTLAMKKKGFFTQLCDLQVGKDKFMVVPRDVQLDPVSDRPVHADFLRVSDKTVIRVEIPVRVANDKSCPGLAKGGALNLVHHEIDVYCKATDIPEEFTLDLSGLDLGDSMQIEDLKLDKSVRPVMQGNFTIVSIVSPSAMKADEAATTEAAAAAATAAAAAPAAAGKDAKAAPAGKDGKAAAPAKDAKAAAPAAKGKK